MKKTVLCKEKTPTAIDFLIYRISHRTLVKLDQ